METDLGGGRSLLQARGGYRERERERERQRKMKEKSGIYSPVEFKVPFFFLSPDLLQPVCVCLNLTLSTLQEGGGTCILLWAKSLSVSILRSGRWEDHDLTPSTFGEGVSPNLHGSSCDKTKAR